MSGNLVRLTSRRATIFLLGRKLSVTVLKLPKPKAPVLSPRAFREKIFLLVIQISFSIEVSSIVQVISFVCMEALGIWHRKLPRRVSIAL